MGIAIFALWAITWPTNYGVNAHSAWIRLGAALLLVVRGLFIGYACAVAIVSPALTWRTSDDQEPFPTATRTLKRLWVLLRTGA